MRMSTGTATSSVKRSCPACSSAARKDRGSKYGYELLSCKNCGTLYTPVSPRKTKAETYDEWYNPENSSASIPEFIHRRLDEIVESFASYRQTNRFLDVGCGAGALLQAATRAGWNAQGQEISRTGCEQLRRLGITAYHGDLIAAAFPADHFDVVTAVEVVEHLPDPQTYVREVARILRPGGLFWGTTPHGGGASARVLGTHWSMVGPPDHLQLFSIKGIRTMFQNASFRRVRVFTEGINPYELLAAWRSPKTNGTRAGGEELQSEESQTNFLDARYSLNESLTKSPLRKTLKDIINFVLSVSRQGDSIKIYAEK